MSKFKVFKIVPFNIFTENEIETKANWVLYLKSSKAILQLQYSLFVF